MGGEHEGGEGRRGIWGRGGAVVDARCDWDGSGRRGRMVGGKDAVERGESREGLEGKRELERL